MNIEHLKNILKTNKTKSIDNNLSFAVLVPLVEINNEINIIYEVRSKSIKQPGEISFPGGLIEEDELPVDAAIRETWEEIGIIKENIDIISELDYVSAPARNGSFVYPFVGVVSNTEVFELKYNSDEVSELFTVPLSFFMENEPEKHYINYFPKTDENFPHHMINNGIDYKWQEIRNQIYFYKYNDYIIWGLTAKITYELVQKLK